MKPQRRPKAAPVKPQSSRRGALAQPNLRANWRAGQVGADLHLQFELMLLLLLCIVCVLLWFQTDEIEFVLLAGQTLKVCDPNFQTGKLSSFRTGKLWNFRTLGKRKLAAPQTCTLATRDEPRCFGHTHTHTQLQLSSDEEKCSPTAEAQTAELQADKYFPASFASVCQQHSAASLEPNWRQSASCPPGQSVIQSQRLALSGLVLQNSFSLV